MALNAACECRLCRGHNRPRHAASFVEEEKNVVGVKSRKCIRLLVGISRTRPTLERHEPSLRILIGKYARLRPGELGFEEFALRLPFGHLRPEAVRQIRGGD